MSCSRRDVPRPGTQGDAVGNGVAEQAVKRGVFPVDGQLAALRVPGQPASPLQVPADAGGDGVQQLIEVGLGGWRRAVELEPVMAASIDSVQHQQVKVDVQVQRAAKALDQGHGAGLRGCLGQSRLADQVRGDGPVDDTEHGRQDGRFGGKQEAQQERHAQDPLAQRLGNC